MGGVQCLCLVACACRWRNLCEHVLHPEAVRRLEHVPLQPLVALDSVDPEVCVAQQDGKVRFAALRESEVPQALGEVLGRHLVAPRGAPLVGSKGAAGLALEHHVQRSLCGACLGGEAVDVPEQLWVLGVAQRRSMLARRVARQCLVLLHDEGL